MIKYAYIKNGNVVEQLKRIVASDKKLTTSGPDAFITDFLVNRSSNPILLLSRYGFHNDSYQYKNINSKVFSYPPKRIIKILSGPITFFKTLYFLLKFKPDRILCGSTKGMLWACFIVSYIYSVPLVHSRHNRILGKGDPWYSRLTSAIDDWCIRRLKGIICHGPYLKHQLEQINIPSSKIFDFDVGFSDMLSELDNSSLKYNISELENKDIILYIGRMEFIKGIYDLLEACREKLLKCQNLKLIYAGTGSYEEKIKKEVADCHLGDSVLFLGNVPHSKLSSILKCSRLLIAPTRPDFPEGRCMAVMEGLVFGVPVIAPDFGPFPFLVKHEVNGLIFNAGSIDDLKLKISTALDDQELYKKLKDGAYKTGQGLLEPNMTFNQAVESAFR